MSDPRRLDIVEKAKRIRKILKAEFPRAVFKVTVDRYSMGEAIDVCYVDGPAGERVEKLVEPFERVHRCEVTGEILGGGNCYIHIQRRYSPEAEEEAKAYIRNRYTVDDWDRDPNYRAYVWRHLREASA